MGGECSLDEVKMRSGLDPRTTLMIRNIPNKYTEEMLLSKFDHLVPGAFDFFYLPMDEKNKCNVGYAFINVSAQPFVPVIYDLLHNKKWDRFNSEKVCVIRYARIQGVQLKDLLVRGTRKTIS